MTDGFPELFNSNKEMLGFEKIKNAFYKVINKTPNLIVKYLNECIDSWCNDFPLQDDLTVLIFKVKAS
jgi:serine phosphatase RsbU (regulator of sigma subunit)